jgi:hypothetical protein
VDILEELNYYHLDNFTKKGDYFAADLKREKTPKLMLSATYDYNKMP